MNGMHYEVALGRMGEMRAEAARDRASRPVPTRGGWRGRLRGLLPAL